jgi:hypothetical protein
VGLQSTDGGHQLQPCGHGPLSVILVRMGVAEVDQHPVAHKLRDETAHATDGLGDARLIGRNDLAQVLPVHPSGERSRADEITEHHRDLASFGGV